MGIRETLIIMPKLTRPKYTQAEVFICELEYLLPAEVSGVDLYTLFQIVSDGYRMLVANLGYIYLQVLDKPLHGMPEDQLLFAHRTLIQTMSKTLSEDAAWENKVSHAKTVIKQLVIAAALAQSEMVYRDGL